MRLKCILPTLSAFLLFAGIQGCDSYAEDMPGGFPPTEVSTLTVEPQDISISRHYIGETVPSMSVEIKAQISARLVKVLFKDGQNVNQGDLLYVLDSAPFKADVASANANRASATARVNQAQREVNRLKPLAKQNAASKQQLDLAQAELELANAALMLAQASVEKAELNLSYTRITAPFSGVVAATQKHPGAWIVAGEAKPLTVLRQLDPIHVYFSVPESEQLQRFNEQAQGLVVWPDDEQSSVKLTLADQTTWQNSGQIDYRSAQVDKNSGSFLQRAKFTNSQLEIKSGQFVRVLINGGKRPNALMIPQDAVLDNPQGKFVYVLTTNEHGKTVAKPSNVVLGEWVNLGATHQEKMWQVKSGLNAGDKIIINNLAKLYPFAVVNVVSTAKGD